MRNCAIERVQMFGKDDKPAPNSEKPGSDTCNHGAEGEEEEEIMDDMLVDEAGYR